MALMKDMKQLVLPQSRFSSHTNSIDERHGTVGAATVWLLLPWLSYFLK